MSVVAEILSDFLNFFLTIYDILTQKDIHYVCQSDKLSMNANIAFLNIESAGLKPVQWMICLLLVWLPSGLTNAQPSHHLSDKDIKGMYGHPKAFWTSGVKLSTLGVNAIFVRSQSIDQQTMDAARSDGLLVFAEFATLNGKNYVNDHPEAWPIDENGEKAPPASWFMGVCPTDSGFLAHRLDQLRQLLSTFALDGIWMDYVHWHAQFEEPSPILPETCFCRRCMGIFGEYASLAVPEGDIAGMAKWILEKSAVEWRDWRCHIIADWVRNIRAIMEEIRPGILLGIYHCPWTDNEFDGARRKNLGIDYDTLTPLVDVYSPMVYHERMGRHPDWVEDNVMWLTSRVAPSSVMIWPIVQAHDHPGTVEPEEFKTVLESALSASTNGVMMFTSGAVAENEQKIKIVKEVYGGNP